MRLFGRAVPAVLKRAGSGVITSGLEFQFCHLLAKCPWENSSTSVHFIFLINKVGI